MSEIRLENKTNYPTLRSRIHRRFNYNRIIRRARRDDGLDDEDRR